MSFLSRKIDKRIALYQEELINTHYAEVDNMYKQIRGWRHDYKNHIQVMKALASKGDLEALKNYLNELETDLATVDTVIKTGNAMADAILNSKISLAKSKGVKVIADANIPIALTISEIDLCVIIGNLFDNAIEASLGLPEREREIRVYMDMKGNKLYISFTNFTSGKKLNKIGSIFKSNKGDGHGFGLLRIDDIIERHSGYISRNSEDGAFTTEILLPQNYNSSPNSSNSSPKS
ncbi:MAG: GHKL domain-containing protein [Ruminococcaceae bacterium]|nr:GHKL domain-containing protein [Oscillospiraceae bacterium]